MESIKLAGNVDWSLNEIDTSQFKCIIQTSCMHPYNLSSFFLALVENIRLKDKDNWNLSSDQMINFASSLRNFFTQSGLMQKVNHRTLKTDDIISM